MESFDILIVGGGHAGAQCAIMLRQLGFAGTVAIVTDEDALPYERPPLSKEYLSGEKPFERLLIRPESFWDDRNVVMLRGSRVVTVEPGAHVVSTADGGTIRYGSLVWAAGGSVRRLTCPGADLDGVHYIRNLADVDRLRGDVEAATRVAVIGGGYVGLESAAVLAKLGKQVTVIEAQDRLLARVAGAPLSRFYEAQHRAHGVALRLGSAVEALEGEERVGAVRLSGGETIGCDLVVAGIGILPEVAPLLAAGAHGGNGVAVDAQCRTSLPDIYAAGDCALHVNGFAGEAPIRLESVQNANDQATVVAKTILGQDAEYRATPWFWSNQYDLKLQTVGLSAGHDAAVVRQHAAPGAMSVIYLKHGTVVAADCVNAVKDYVQARKLVEARAVVDAARLADPAVPLKELLG